MNCEKKFGYYEKKFGYCEEKFAYYEKKFGYCEEKFTNYEKKFFEEKNVSCFTNIMYFVYKAK